MNLRVILVEPKYDGNIGSIARAMKNFGFHNLVLVNPCSIDDFGHAMASHARDILEKAQKVRTLEEALNNTDLVVGTTGKRMGNEQRHLRLHIRVPCLSPKELAGKLNGKDGTIALLLGREDCGLTDEELAICDMVVSIPTSADYPIMNISHAAAVLLYELSQVMAGEAKLASRDSLLLLQDRARILLKEISYPEHKSEYTVLMLRRVFGRAELTEREARTLLGIIKNIRWTLKPRQREMPGSENSSKSDLEI
ncbi:MAG: RNA methyltransferase [Methanotrichaceae archaeon]